MLLFFFAKSTSVSYPGGKMAVSVIYEPTSLILKSPVRNMSPRTEPGSPCFFIKPCMLFVVDAGSLVTGVSSKLASSKNCLVVI